MKFTEFKALRTLALNIILPSPPFYTQAQLELFGSRIGERQAADFALSTLHSSVSLDYVTLRFGPWEHLRPASNAAKHSAIRTRLLDDYRTCQRIKKLETALVELVETDRLGYVRVEFYTIPPTSLEIRSIYSVFGPDLAKSAFPRLEELGSLRV